MTTEERKEFEGRRLGKLNPDGSYNSKPALDINGGQYNAMLSVARLGDDLFVVLPVNFSNHTLLDEVRTEFGKKAVSHVTPYEPKKPKEEGTL